MDNEVFISTKIDVDYAKAERQLAAIQRQIEKLTRKRTLDVELKIQAAKAAQAVRERLEEEKKKLESMRGDLTATPQVPAQEALVKSLQANYDKLIRQVDKYGESINKTTVQLNQLDKEAQQAAASIAENISAQKEAITESGGTHYAQAPQKSAQELLREAEAANQVGRGMKEAAKHTSAFAARLGQLVKATLVFNVISRALNAVRTWFGKVIEANNATATAMNNFKASLMTLVQPLIDTVLPLIERVLAALTKVVSFIATIMATLFGSTLSASAASASALNDSVNGAASGLGSANANAKALKRTLAGFDELTLLEPQDTGGGGGGGGSVGITPASFDAFSGLDFSDILNTEELEALKKLGETIAKIFGEIWQTVKDIVQLIIDLAKDIDFVPILESITTLLESIWKIIQPMINTFKKVWEKFIAPIIKKLVEEYLPRILDSFSEMNEALGLVNEAVEPIIETLAEVLEPIIEIVLEIFTEIIGLINGSGKDALQFIAKILTKLAPLIEAVLRILAPVIEALLTIIEAVNELSECLNDTLWFILNLIIDLITGDMDAAREDFDGYIEDMGGHLEGFMAIGETMRQKFGEIWGAISRTATTAWNGVKQAASTAWSNIQTTWGVVSGWFQNNVITPVRNAWQTAINAIGGFFSGLWNGIKTGVVNAMNACIAGVEWAINWFISGINNFIAGINSITNGKLAQKVGLNFSIGSIGYVSLGRIPYLAQGAVIPPNNPFLATLGDNTTETEIVSPLSTMKQALAEALAEANFKGDVNVYLDGRQISSSVTKYQLQANRAYGI